VDAPLAAAFSESVPVGSLELELPRPGESISVVLKLPGETCNINCLYCYEKRKPYPGQTHLTAATLAMFMERAGDRPLSVMLHGGEPLLVGRKRMAELIAVLRRHSQPVALSLQTNGLLLDGRWLDFFEAEWPELDIGISLDGDEAGNAYRVDYRNRPTYAGVVRALRELERRGTACGVIVVVTGKLLGRAADVVAHMGEYGCIKNVKLSPCLDYKVTSKEHRGSTGAEIKLLNPTGSIQPGWATTPAEYGRFVAEATVAWRDSGAYRKFLLEPFVSVVRAHRGQPTGFTHFDHKKDPYVVTLYPDGRIGSCDELAMPDALMGHVQDNLSIDELISRAATAPLFNKLENLLSECTGCRVVDICRGGSLPDRARYDVDSYRSDYCDYRRAFIDDVVAMLPKAGVQQDAYTTNTVRRD
jgi:radical SAM protein with 4Fe4S-binding SPASM domain